jgi:aminoglycoside-2''-adenylyltransferase
MLGNAPLWDAAERVHQVLAQSGIDHAIVGGVAVCLHGYQRNTVDLDLLIRSEDAAAFKAVLEADGFEWQATEKEFLSPSGVPVQCVITGENEGSGQETKFPDPADPKAVTTVEGLPVLSLARLIQAKIACGLGNMRRTHKDFADVVELVAIHQLDGSFARFLHRSVRKEFRELVRRVRG